MEGKIDTLLKAVQDFQLESTRNLSKLADEMSIIKDMIENRNVQYMGSIPIADDLNFSDIGPGYTETGVAGMGNCVVYQVKDEDNNSFALKLIPLKEGEITPNMSRELAIMFDIEHDHIVRLRRAFVYEKNLCLVMDLMCSDIQQRISLGKHPSLDGVKKWLGQIISAAAYLHKRNIVHRDIKPENVLVSADGNLKLADFGLARGMLKGDQLTPQGKVTTLQYRAPEVLLGCDTYTSAVDMWAIGCIFWEIVTFEMLFKAEGETKEEMLDQIFKTLGTPTEASWPGVTLNLMFLKEITFYEPQVLEVGTNIDANGLDLMRKLLVLNPRDRITAEEALEHPFLSKSP